MTAGDPQSFDSVAEGYDFLATLATRGHRHDLFLEHLPARRGRALDVGCGCGHLARELAERFDEVVGVDVSEPMLAIARTRRVAANLRYVWADAEALEPPRDLDLIASHTTFHHLKDPPRMLERLRGALRPGGRLVVVDNVHPRPQVSWAVVLGAPALGLPADLFRYGAGDAVRKLRVRYSRGWMAHLRSDRYLSEAGFRAVYGAALPGASFRRIGVFMGVVWERPAGP